MFVFGADWVAVYEVDRRLRCVRVEAARNAFRFGGYLRIIAGET